MDGYWLEEASGALHEGFTSHSFSTGSPDHVLGADWVKDESHTRGKWARRSCLRRFWCRPAPFLLAGASACLDCIAGTYSGSNGAGGGVLWYCEVFADDILLKCSFEMLMATIINICALTGLLQLAAYTWRMVSLGRGHVVRDVRRRDILQLEWCGAWRCEGLIMWASAIPVDGDEGMYSSWSLSAYARWQMRLLCAHRSFTHQFRSAISDPGRQNNVEICQNVKLCQNVKNRWNKWA